MRPEWIIRFAKNRLFRQQVRRLRIIKGCVVIIALENDSLIDFGDREAVPSIDLILYSREPLPFAGDVIRERGVIYVNATQAQVHVYKIRHDVKF